MRREEFLKIIIVLRHAHRDTSERASDNGLDEKGRHQVAELLSALKKGKLPLNARFYSSPKQRCTETLKPLADYFSEPLNIEPLLDEQSHGESHKDYLNRIQNLVQWVCTLPDTTYLCSHGDVIPELLNELTGKSVQLKKSEYAEVGFDGSGWRLL